MSLKTKFVCLPCSKILEKPIAFPCGCTVCGIHLHDEEVHKSNKIKCIDCNIEFNVNENEFRPNKLAEKILRQGFLLNNEEKTFKVIIEQKMFDLWRLDDEMSLDARRNLCLK